MNPLIGSRIILREYASSDSVAIHKWRNDRATTRWMGPKFADPISFEKTAESLDKVVNHPPSDAAYFAIADKRTHEYVGGIDLTSIDPSSRQAVLSIVIGESTNRDKGYGTEAIQLLMLYAFESLNLNRVLLNVAAENQRALRCYQKSGFRVVGTEKGKVLVDGEHSDLIQMALSATEFRSSLNAMGSDPSIWG